MAGVEAELVRRGSAWVIEVPEEELVLACAAADLSAPRVVREAPPARRWPVLAGGVALGALVGAASMAILLSAPTRPAPEVVFDRDGDGVIDAAHRFDGRDLRLAQRDDDGDGVFEHAVVFVSRRAVTRVADGDGDGVPERWSRPDPAGRGLVELVDQDRDGFPEVLRGPDGELRALLHPATR